MNFLTNLKQNLSTHGYIGDTRLPLLAYLTIVSALRDDPVSLLIKGPASSGKSYALDCAKRYLPPVAYEQFEGMSERAILYLGDQIDLRHKTLIIQEAAGMSQGQGRVYLRQLLTEGEIRYVTVQNTEAGLVGTELPTVEGPVGLIMTTTASTIHHEDESRMLSFHIDDCPERTRDILVARTTRSVTEPTDSELEEFHLAYLNLRDANVSASVPFETEIAIALPVSHPRILRDFPKVIALVETVALLHRDEREVDAQGRVVATLEDYEFVRELLDDTISQGLESSVPDGVRRVVEAVQALTNAETSDNDPFVQNTSVTQHQVAEYMRVNRSTVSRHVYYAINAGFLEDWNHGQGRSSQLRLGQRALPSGSVLPSSESVLLCSQLAAE